MAENKKDQGVQGNQGDQSENSSFKKAEVSPNENQINSEKKIKEENEGQESFASRNPIILLPFLN